MNTKRHAYVALSGGVDSAVAAINLLEQAYQVTGIFMKTWRDPLNLAALNELATTTELVDKVAQSVGIPLVVLDVRDTFYQTVIRSFIDKYSSGETPNPCLFCNPQIKWGILQTYALEHGGDWFATGHYAQIQAMRDGNVQLMRGADRLKDQSYVLAMLSQYQLRHTLLPLGELSKKEVREIAQKHHLFVTDREESQDLCFLEGENYRKFIGNYASQSTRKGEIVNLEGEVLGEHEGLPFYTIGQRKGIKIAASEPYYVIRKEQEKNRLVVGFAEQARSKSLHAINVNWIAGKPVLKGECCQVMIRYRAKPISAKLTYSSLDEFHLEFVEPLQGVSPGQVAVLYDHEICLGGGMIKSAS